METYILQLTPLQFSTRITNVACHNYCVLRPMPLRMKSLLGLGLKYCIKQPLPSNNWKQTLTRLKKDVHRIRFFKLHPPEEDDNDEIRYIPGLYFKNEAWEPSCKKCSAKEKCRVCKTTDTCLANFERELLRRQSFYMKRPSISNITPNQRSLINDIKGNDDYIVIEADKNLGGAIMDVPIYTERGIKEHLGNKDVYKPVSKLFVKRRLQCLRYQIFVFTNKWRNRGIMSKAEDHYLNEACHRYGDKVARFRMSLKAHKNPYKMRPIVCCVGTFMNALSKWLDFWLQKLKPFVPTYIKDSTNLLDLLDELGPLPPNARLFTADANSMYTNIDTDHAIEVISEWLDNLATQIYAKHPNFPIEAIKEAMELVMRNNIFEWGDMYFLQLLGTAMGTSAACMWATIYFGVHESRKLIPTYQNQLSLLRRFIDDKIGIWVGTDFEWQCFKQDTNNFGILTWEFEEPSLSVVFLDLTISIERGQIVYKTFQKALNLYQYIPPTSAHPPWMMRGIIYSLMRNYRRQNTNIDDYYNVAIKLFDRHVARGWDRATMRDYILDADRKLSFPSPTTQPNNTPPTTPSNKERLFIHMEYQPHDIPRKHVRAIYDMTCKEVFEHELGITQTTIAYSRPKNIKDLVTKAKLHQAPGKPVSKYYSGELSAT